MKKRLLALLLASAVMCVIAGCAAQMKDPELAQQTPEWPKSTYDEPKFTYDKDIWSDRRYECRQMIIDRLMQDVSHTDYPFDETFADSGILFTQSTMEETQSGTRLVVRGILNHAVTGAANFVKLSYAFGDSLSEIERLDRGDEVQNAKFFCDLTDHLEDLKLEKAEINTQIDAFEFYKTYSEGMKNQFGIRGKGYDEIVSLYNYFHGTTQDDLFDLDGSFSTEVSEFITFVGEYTTTTEDGVLVGYLPIDCYIEAGTTFHCNDALNGIFKASYYSSYSHLLRDTENAGASLEDFMFWASNNLLDFVELDLEINDMTYAAHPTDEGFVVLDNGIELTESKANKSFATHDFSVPLPDHKISIRDLSESEEFVFSYF